MASSSPCRSLAALLLSFVVLLLNGCFVGTPKEEIDEVGGQIEFLEQGGIRLTLTGSRVSDADMHAVTALCSNHREYTAIRLLDLSDTRISNKGLEILCQLETLEELNLSNTRVTEAGIRKFEATVPDCRVVRE